MRISIDNKKVDELLTRGVEEAIDKADLKKALKSGRQLRVKLGIDPTSPNLHIGRSIPLFKLRDFQELGHKVIFIIGDFTGVIGDTSDKDSERPMLDEEVISKNMRDYIKQTGKIIDTDKCEVRYNSEWLAKLDYGDISKQANIFSVNQFITRENIRRRLDEGKRVSLREVLYPIMQGYDSVAIKADVEVGGTDQKFNLLAGREMQRFYNQEPQNIITNPLIEGLDGRKMSSSWGNTVNLLDSPRKMYGSLMSLKDEFIIKYFILTTRVDLKEMSEYKREISNGANPKDIKMKLAYELVRFYHSEKAAKQEQQYFVETFSKKQTPDDLADFKPSKYDLMTFLFESKLVKSKSDAKRVLSQKGLKVNQKIVEDVGHPIKKGDVIQKGKISFIRVG